MTIEVRIWFESAAKPGDDPRPTHTEREEFETEAEAVEFVRQRINVDDLEESGVSYDGRKRYGYWSAMRSRETGKKWYEWADVEFRRLERQQIDAEEVLNQ